MEVVKYYIDYKTYRNVILVSKDMHMTVKDMEGPLMLARLLEKGGWSYQFKKTISRLEPMEMLKDLIHTLEHCPYLMQTDYRIRNKGLLKRLMIKRQSYDLYLTWTCEWSLFKIDDKSCQIHRNVYNLKQYTRLDNPTKVVKLYIIYI
jgi:hypothetical protein